MPQSLEADFCIIGAGSGGLSLAAGASQLGARVVLIERGAMGGDCLNFGCVPSKATIAAAHTAHAMRHAGRFGITPVAPDIDRVKLRDHVQGVIAAIAPNDSVDRFEGLGVTVLQSEARFTGPNAVATSDGDTVEAKYYVIATGSSPMVPPIPGLDETPYFTNETIFDNADEIKHLVIIGGGPIGMELAQAHRRLGAEVTVIEMFTAFAKDDPECAAIVKRRIEDDGVTLLENTKVVSVRKNGAGIAVAVERDGEEFDVEGSHLLVAAGRKPNIDALNLDAAGVDHDKRGVKVDPTLRSSNRQVYAIGDVIGGLQFTHMANYHAGILIRRLLFKMFWTKTDTSAFPWVTYTDPELAHVGITEETALKMYGKGGFRILRWTFFENDRAQAEHETDGLVKVITDAKGRVKGATIAGPRAGDLILPWVVAIGAKQKIGTMAGLTFPYPTLSEVSKRAAGSFFTPSLFSDRTKSIVRFLLKF